MSWLMEADVPSLNSLRSPTFLLFVTEEAIQSLYSIANRKMLQIAAVRKYKRGCSKKCKKLLETCYFQRLASARVRGRDRCPHFLTTAFRHYENKADIEKHIWNRSKQERIE